MCCEAVIFLNNVSFQCFKPLMLNLMFVAEGYGLCHCWLYSPHWSVPDISQIKLMAQVLLQSAQLFSPRKTAAVSLRCFWFVVSQPRANKEKQTFNCLASVILRNMITRLSLLLDYIIKIIMIRRLNSETEPTLSESVLKTTEVCCFL